MDRGADRSDNRRRPVRRTAAGVRAGDLIALVKGHAAQSASNRLPRHMQWATLLSLFVSEVVSLAVVASGNSGRLTGSD
jgi:hypothetical protein